MSVVAAEMHRAGCLRGCRLSVRLQAHATISVGFDVFLLWAVYRWQGVLVKVMRVRSVGGIVW